MGSTSHQENTRDCWIQQNRCNYSFLFYFTRVQSCPSSEDKPHRQMSASILAWQPTCISKQISKCTTKPGKNRREAQVPSRDYLNNVAGRSFLQFSSLHKILQYEIRCHHWALMNVNIGTKHCLPIGINTPVLATPLSLFTLSLQSCRQHYSLHQQIDIFSSHLQMNTLLTLSSILKVSNMSFMYWIQKANLLICLRINADILTVCKMSEKQNLLWSCKSTPLLDFFFFTVFKWLCIKTCCSFSVWVCWYVSSMPVELIRCSYIWCSSQNRCLQVMIPSFNLLFHELKRSKS